MTKKKSIILTATNILLHKNKRRLKNRYFQRDYDSIANKYFKKRNVNIVYESLKENAEVTDNRSVYY